MLNEKYLRMTALVWEDILEKSRGKHHNDTKYTGATVPAIIMSSAKKLNNQEEGGDIEVDHMYMFPDIVLED